jgi:hypothetical protein
MERIALASRTLWKLCEDIENQERYVSCPFELQDASILGKKYINT